MSSHSSSMRGSDSPLPNIVCQRRNRVYIFALVQSHDGLGLGSGLPVTRKLSVLYEFELATCLDINMVSKLGLGNSPRTSLITVKIE